MFFLVTETVIMSKIFKMYAQIIDERNFTLSHEKFHHIQNKNISKRYGMLHV